MLFGFVIRFEIPSFTHPLEIVMLFGPKNLNTIMVAIVYTFYWNLKLSKEVLP